MADQPTNGSSKPNSSLPGGTATDAPHLALPKGGGAIRGIGEKFAANPVTGTGSLTVPIYTSPGRSGFGPQLALSYNSGAGNGAFGFGWSMQLPAVTRKTDKGLPRYNDPENSDIFLLSGAEDMMPSLVESGGKWAWDMSSRSLYGNEYIVQGYRPRVEGLFARIERWANSSDSSDVFWRTISKENITTWFGQSAESRIADPSDPTRIFSWLISGSYDDTGNVIAYSYKAEDSSGVDLSQANERNRTTPSRSAQRYLKYIYYGNRTPYFPDLNAPAATALPTDWCFEVVFDYGEHDPQAPTPTEIQPWICRLDPFSTYRPTFEVRTYRICQRVLMFHDFPTVPNVGANCLVRSTDLVHASSLPADPSQPFYSYLLSASQSGYTQNGAGGYVSKALPPIDFTYTEAVIDETVRDLDPESQMNLPSGMDGSNYRWIDLDGEGVSGILTEQAGAWFYKANLSPANVQGTGPTALTLPWFAPVRTVEQLPSLAALSSGRQQLLGLSGDGFLSLVQFDGPTPGYFERTEEFGWEPFMPFQSMPVVDWRNPNLRFIDLTGDGFADALISEDDVFWWHNSLSTDGFAEAQRVPQSLDEETGPQLVFADGTESIFLADMSGDGLTDLVRIRAGEVCYWPNLGYGRFGAKVTMDGVPRFDRQELFDARRVHLADIDGSGTADILYFAAGKVDIYFSQSGNSFAEQRVLSHFPLIDTASSAAVLDLLGNGTACLVWSSPLTGNARAPMRYIDLMGGVKPHLLVGVVNNLGAETTIRYAPSTKFYVADKLAGTPWITRLPFPVQVVEQIETVDVISRNRFVTCYAYHHGYYDGVEREFRGFARVDQWDTEDFATLNASSALPQPTNENAASNVPPVLTKTWFHTGFFFNAAAISTQLQSEYYREGDAATGLAGLSPQQTQALLLPDTVLPTTLLLADGSRLPYDLSGEEMREACRALRGSMLRREVYALDGTEAADRPYTTSEKNYTIEVLQPQGPNPYGVFLTYSREALELHYERQLFPVVGDTLADPSSPPPPGATLAADPRVTHSMTLAVDGYGNPLQSASIAYGRRFLDPALSSADQASQQTLLATATLNSFTNAVTGNDVNRTPLSAQSSVYQLLQCQPTANLPNFTNLFAFAEMQTLVAAASDGAHDIAFENLNPTGLNAGQPYRRLLNSTRTLYRPDDLGQVAGNPDALLPLGTLESMALPGNSYKQALTLGIIPLVFTRSATALLPTPVTVLGSTAADGGGYVDLDTNGNWWIPGTRVYYSPTAGTALQENTVASAHFYLPQRFVDPFGNTTTVAYDDPHDLLVISTTDAVGNVVQAQNDYRVLAPTLLTDANGNQTAARFDALGLMVGTAVMGKAGQNIGDSFTTFTVDLTQAQIDAFFTAADPHTLAAALLGTATTRIIYSLQQYVESSQAAPTNPAAWQPVFAATLAREIHVSDLTKGTTSPVQVNFSYSDGFGREIQKKLQADPGPVTGGGPVVNPRWIGSGWTIFNNKGKPVRQYEPFYSSLPALGHQFEFGVQVGVSPILCYDPVDRVIATVHPNQTYEKIVFDPWHQQNWDVNDTVLVTDPTTDPDVGDFFSRLAPADYSPTWYTQRSGGALGPQEQNAATKAAAHANTPTTIYFDALGRAMLTVVDNAAAGKYLTHTERDIQGYQRSVTDALGREVVTYDYDMLGTALHQSSMEAGQRWTLNDVAGKTIRSWDDRGHNRRAAYDGLRRPTNLYVLGTDAANSDPRTLAAEVCYENTIYGEGQAPTLNLSTRVFQHGDAAGLSTNMALNPVTNLQEAFDFKGNLLRSSRQFVSDPKALTNWSGAAPTLLAAYTASTLFDALNRPTALTSPDASVTTPTYNERNALNAVSVNLQGTAAPTNFVTGIDYDAKGQRLQITYANAGTNTVYTYDPQTFRLTGLTTTRPASPANQQTVQDLAYTYDPTGNITHIQDDADIQNAVFFRNVRVEPSCDFTYDAIYRLIEATGREQLGLGAGNSPLAPTPTSYNDVPRAGLLQPGDGNAMGIYDEQYQYDAVGNFTNFIHRGTNPANPGWTRSYSYNEASLLDAAQVSNRLSLSTIAGNLPFVEKYSYDPHGNMTSMPQLQAMQWDFKDQLYMTQRQAVNAGDTDGTQHQGQQTFYVYNAGGERARKATFSSAGIMLKQRFYLGGYELYQEYDAQGNVTLERESLHVMDDKQRIVLIETTTVDNSVPAATLPSATTRYQFSNHLGTACLELDETAAVISYEEYYPYGSTSYQAGLTVAEVGLKRYRYTGKERDEETGLYYHGARYYAAWIGRWTAADPAGLKDGPDLYAYVRNNPIRLSDRDGRQGTANEEEHININYDLYYTPGSPAIPYSGSFPPVPDPTPTPPPVRTTPASPQTPTAPEKPAAAPDGPPPTSVNTSVTASSATARAGTRENEATTILSVGGNTATGFVGSLGVLAAVRYSLSKPFTGPTAPIGYAWDVGGVLGATKGLSDSSRSSTFGLTARYGSGTDYSKPSQRVSVGAAFTATLNPAVDAAGKATYPFTAGVTGVLETASTEKVTVDVNAVASTTVGGGSTMFTGVSLSNTGTVGAQAQVGIDIGYRLTLGPEAVVYGTFGSGAPTAPGAASPSISSLRTGGGVGLSLKLGDKGIPSSVVGFQLDTFYESTRVGATPGAGATTIRGGGVGLNVGVTF
jgi:RHS repeat-associated protein